jgi:Fe-S-cluster containining protein
LELSERERTRAQPNPDAVFTPRSHFKHVRTLEAELGRARDLDVSELADAIESIGFECTRCGACCKGYTDADGEAEPHTATVFPDEVRDLQAATDYDWRDVARPMPYGLVDGDDGPEGETFEWALQTDSCGDCAFYREDDDGVGACAVHDDRPLICRTYPFSVPLGGTSQPMGEAVDEEGMVRAHECEGLGRDISRDDAEDLARALKVRAVRELEEAIGVRDNYRPAFPGPDDVVVHDSEGAKRPDGTSIE